MSTWRKMAIECAPELRKDFEQPDTSIYTVFSDLLSILQEAHKINDEGRLQKIYAYAEWCFHQKEQSLWNAAAVSFYEHLGDKDETLAHFTKWIKKDIYVAIRGLLALRFPNQKLVIMDAFYKDIK